MYLEDGQLLWDQSEGDAGLNVLGDGCVYMLPIERVVSNHCS